MRYFNDDDEYVGYYGEDDEVEVIKLLSEGYSEKEQEDILYNAGLIHSRAPRLMVTMEQLVFAHGDPDEVYSHREISFTEHVPAVYVYHDFMKKMNKGAMPCRTLAIRIEAGGNEAIHNCIAFEKIANKALDGFNIFFFMTDDGVLFGCKLFEHTGHKDCILSSPLKAEAELEEIIDALASYSDEETFANYYEHITHTIRETVRVELDFETELLKKRARYSHYLEDINELEKTFGVGFEREKQRFYELLEKSSESGFLQMIEEIEEELSFIQSNKINTYEMMFDAEEMVKRALQAEEDLKYTATQTEEQPEQRAADEEASFLMDDPEEMIKLFKKRRGL